MSEDNKTTIIEAGSKGVASAVMPYAALGIVAFLGIKYLEKQDWPEFPDFGGMAGGIYENITDRVENTTKYVEKTIIDKGDTIYLGGTNPVLEGENTSKKSGKKEDIMVDTNFGQKNVLGGVLGNDVYKNMGKSGKIDSASATGTGTKTTTKVIPSGVYNFMPTENQIQASQKKADVLAGNVSTTPTAAPAPSPTTSKYKYAKPRIVSR